MGKRIKKAVVFDDNGNIILPWNVVVVMVVSNPIEITGIKKEPEKAGN